MSSQRRCQSSCHSALLPFIDCSKFVPDPEPQWYYFCSALFHRCSLKLAETNPSTHRDNQKEPGDIKDKEKKSTNFVISQVVSQLMP